MKRTRSIRGYTMVELVSMLTLLGLVTSTGVVIGSRALARYHLDAAARTLAADIERTKMRAIQTNSTATVRIEAARRYRAAGVVRQLPSGVRFSVESAPSITFNAMGAVQSGTSRRFVLSHPNGGTWVVRVFVGGGQEVRKL